MSAMTSLPSTMRAYSGPPTFSLSRVSVLIAMIALKPMTNSIENPAMDRAMVSRIAKKSPAVRHADGSATLPAAPPTDIPHTNMHVKDVLEWFTEGYAGQG